MRIVIAESSWLLRAGLARLLEDAGFDVVGHAADADELLRKVRGHRPDVAVIDICVPAGLPAARRIRAEQPRIGLLLLSDRVDVRHAAELLDHGPAGVGILLKDRIAQLDRFADAIRDVARGGSALDPLVVTEVLGRRRRDGPLDALTLREREVLAGMAKGESNGAIARRLFVSQSAIERHVTAIFTKLRLDASRDAHRRVLAVLAYLATDWATADQVGDR